MCKQILLLFLLSCGTSHNYLTLCTGYSLSICLLLFNSYANRQFNCFVSFANEKTFIYAHFDCASQWGFNLILGASRYEFTRFDYARYRAHYIWVAVAAGQCDQYKYLAWTLHTHTQTQAQLAKKSHKVGRGRGKNISSYFFFTVYYKLNFPFKNINPPRSERKEMHAAVAAENRTENREHIAENRRARRRNAKCFCRFFSCCFCCAPLPPICL